MALVFACFFIAVMDHKMHNNETKLDHFKKLGTECPTSGVDVFLERPANSNTQPANNLPKDTDENEASKDNGDRQKNKHNTQGGLSHLSRRRGVVDRAHRSRRSVE